MKYGRKTGRTDIDVVVRDGGNNLIYYQFKRSQEALKSLRECQAWVEKAMRDLALDPPDYSRVIYALPGGRGNVGSEILDWFDELGIAVKTIAHVN